MVEAERAIAVPGAIKGDGSEKVDSRFISDGLTFEGVFLGYSLLKIDSTSDHHPNVRDLCIAFTDVSIILPEITEVDENFVFCSPVLGITSMDML